MHKNTPLKLMAMSPPHSSSVIGGGRYGLFNADVVKGDVKAPECFECLVQCSLDVLGLGHITADSEHLAAEFLNQAGRFLSALVGHVGDNRAGALTRERQRRSPANAAPGTGHEGNLGCEASV
jgi:hypothetical protein